MTEPLDWPCGPRPSSSICVEELLSKNTSTREALSFLGAGCYPHHVPAVCDEVGSYAEFLTAEARASRREDHGQFQALFEYASMMGELLEMDVVNVPTYDLPGSRPRRPPCAWPRGSRSNRSVVVTAAIGPDELAEDPRLPGAGPRRGARAVRRPDGRDGPRAARDRGR